MTRGDITIHNAVSGHLEIALSKLADAGAQIDLMDNGFRVRCDTRPKAVDVVTLPYPGFPTDLQPHFIAMNSIASGAALVTENLFEARFRFVNEMVRLGADVRTDGHHAMVRGRTSLSGAPVEAADIRAGAGLVLAGLVAEGMTTVYEPHHIEATRASWPISFVLARTSPACSSTNGSERVSSIGARVFELVFHRRATP
jgi:UDP-N-acetylglucosamine 1-carboxyvinyltransferase